MRASPRTASVRLYAVPTKTKKCVQTQVEISIRMKGEEASTGRIPPTVSVFAQQDWGSRPRHSRDRGS